MKWQAAQITKCIYFLSYPYLHLIIILSLPSLK